MDRGEWGSTPVPYSSTYIPFPTPMHAQASYVMARQIYSMWFLAIGHDEEEKKSCSCSVGNGGMEKKHLHDGQTY